MSNERKIYAKFKNNGIEENARWNVTSNFRLRKARKINEEIINRQLETFGTFEKFNNTEGFDTVAEARTAIEGVARQVDDHDAGLELSSRSADSEKARLYGWTILTLLTLTGGIIITKM